MACPDSGPFGEAADTADEGERIYVEVSDMGIGKSSEDPLRIFERLHFWIWALPLSGRTERLIYDPGA